MSFVLILIRRISPAHIFTGEQVGNPTNGKLGICACPGLLNTRPSRSVDVPQRSLISDITALTGLHCVTDIFMIACDWEIQHYNGVSYTEYCSELEKQGLTVHPYYVQETKPPTLQVRHVSSLS
jgi:hypothetical protein|tara:strand:- start:64 stop:435 length:372 start_codon:yes stop_codon:yes gene_type:complete